MMQWEMFYTLHLELLSIKVRCKSSVFDRFVLLRQQNFSSTASKHCKEKLLRK